MLISVDTPSQDLVDQVGEAHWRQRMTRQAQQELKVAQRPPRALFDEDRAELSMVVLYHLLKKLRLYNFGYRNFLDVQIVHNEITLPRLPAALDNYTILHLSDLHIDLDPALTDVLVEKLAPLTYDVCVITGDYRLAETGAYDHMLDLMTRIVDVLHRPTYAILGNHDYIEFVPPLEAMGLRFLLNETIVLEHNGASLYLSGVDDPHYYLTDNVQKARGPITEAWPSILLAHSPAIYQRAAAAGYDLTLCGHTHAGQICLPGRIPLLSNADCPRAMVYGNWQHDQMQGYTSAGTGSSGLPIRFFCPPEITLHTLRSA